LNIFSVVTYLLTVIKISQKNEELQNKYATTNVMKSLVQLFFKYEYNNLLHFQVFDMMKTILLDSKNVSPKLNLIKETELIQKIIKANEKNNEKLKEPKGSSLGYMGFIVEISNIIKNLTQEQPKDSEFVNYIESISGWNDFLNTFLKDINDKNEKQLGGPVPIGGAPTFQSFQDDDDDDDDDYVYDDESSSDSDEEVIVKKGKNDSDSDDSDDSDEEVKKSNVTNNNNNNNTRIIHRDGSDSDSD
jgi:hypothetical protein